MMEIRALTAADLPLVIDLAHRIWPVAYAGVLKPEEIANILGTIYTPSNLQAEMAAGHRFWAAYDGTAALGFASGYRDGESAWLKKLYVLPVAQGRGAGRALVETVAAAFAAARDIRLYVNNGNTAAQAFYRRCGFVKLREVPVKMGDYDFVDFVFARSVSRS
jgi:ribosomal protein S18 acetylase RimI-like enzyme